MRKRVYYYCDMDGVLADFYAQPNAVKRFASEKNFFFHLNPIEKNVNYIRQLIKQGESVRILTASPNKRADKDKRKWLKKYMPFIKRKNIIIVRNGQNKADFVKTKGKNVLFDDYSKNCEQWEAKNPRHIAIQVKGKITSCI